MQKTAVLNEFVQGVKDSCNYYKASKAIWRSKEVYKPLFLSFWLTGGIFLGSIVVHSLIIDPLLKGFPKVERIFTMLYYILWLFPVYMACFILNIFCYSDIANGIYKLERGKPKSADLSLSRMIACEIHRGLIMAVYIITMTLLSLIPYLQFPIISLISWLYSFYCFEYRWVLEGKTINKEIKCIERNAIYYLGFGMPFALITCCFPGLLGNGVWAVLFPLFVVTAILSNPPTEATLVLPVFRHINSTCDRFEVMILGKFIN